MSTISRMELSRRLRQFERFKFEVKTFVEGKSEKAWGRVTDMSRNGLFIEMSEPPGLGAHFTAHLALNVPLQLQCVVRRIAPGRGVGVGFSVPAESKERFEALLTALSLNADPTATAAGAPQTESRREASKLAAAAAAGSRKR